MTNTGPAIQPPLVRILRERGALRQRRPIRKLGFGIRYKGHINSERASALAATTPPPAASTPPGPT